MICLNLFMAEFQIGKSKRHTVIVDDEDLPLVSKYKWSPITNERGKIYVHSGVRPTISIHRLIMGVSSRDVLVDHINHDALDNRKKNLRICNKSQNCSNRRSARGASSKYLGVSKSVSKNVTKWTATISKMRKMIYYGRFDTEIEAAKAYNEWAKEVHGEFANLNVIDELVRPNEHE